MLLNIEKKYNFSPHFKMVRRRHGEKGEKSRFFYSVNDYKSILFNCGEKM